MAKLKSYVITQDIRTPYVVATGMPHKPTRVEFKTYRKGDIVNGDLKRDKSGNPAFLIVNGVVMIPLSVIKEVVTKDVSLTNFDGTGSNKLPKPIIEVKKPQTNRMRYMDAAILGALVGFGGIILAEKQGWLKEIDKKNRIYGAVAGAAAGIYFVFRFKKPIKTEQK